MLKFRGLSLGRFFMLLNADRSRDTTGALSNIRSEIQNYVLILRQTLNEREKIETVRGVLSFTCLSKVIHPKHRYAFKNDKEFLSWLTDNREFQESLPDANIIDGAGNVLFHDDYVVPDKMASSPSFAKRNNRDNNGFHIQDDFEFCDIHDEDDIFNADSDRSFGPQSPYNNKEKQTITKFVLS